MQKISKQKADICQFQKMPIFLQGSKIKQENSVNKREKKIDSDGIRARLVVVLKHKRSSSLTTPKAT